MGGKGQFLGQSGMSSYRIELRSCVRRKVDFVVSEGGGRGRGICVTEAEVSCVGARTEGDDLFGRGRTRGQKAVYKVIDRGGADICPW